ncbi:hypothetical protein Hanom_Chr09g00782461 [Helianthus anomalus]
MAKKRVRGAPHGVFTAYAPQKGRGAKKSCASGAPHGIFMVIFDVFDFLCQFQAFHVFFIYVFDNFDESDDEIS